MFGFHRHHHHHHRHPEHYHYEGDHRRGGRFHFRNRDRRAGGYKAALSNPATSSEGRRHAKHELRMMGGGYEAHVPLSTRIKHALGLRSRHHHHHHHDYRDRRY